MKYHIRMHWNGRVYLEGEASAVMVYQVIKWLGHNFVSPVKANFVLPSLNDLVEAAQGSVFECTADDGTGRAYYKAEAMS